MTSSSSLRSVGLRDLYSDAGRAMLRVLPAAALLLPVLVIPQVWYTRQVLENAGGTPWGSAALIVGFGLTVGLVASAAMLRLVLDGLEGKPDLRAAVGVALRRYPALLGSRLAAGVCVGWGALFCLVPGAVIASSLAIAGPIVLEEGAGPIESVQTAWERMKGFRTVAFTSFLLLVVVVGAAAVVGGFGAGLFLAVVAAASGREDAAEPWMLQGFALTMAAVLELGYLPGLALVAALHRRVAGSVAPSAPLEAPTASVETSTAPPSP